jgi:uncharacterized protein
MLDPVPQTARALGIAIGLITVANSASAASFDCATAKRPQDLLICDTPSLSVADDRMAALYTAALSSVSELGRALLKTSQQSWLRYLSAVCPVSGNVADRVEKIDCLSQKYRRRSEKLDGAIQRKGPFLFVRVDLYAAVPMTEPSSKDQAFSIHEVSYPQIDEPTSEQTNWWNAISTRRIEPSQLCDGRYGDETTSYVIDLATSSLISVTWSDSWYCHGTSHGYGSSHTETTVLAPSPHLIEPSDLFRSDVDWDERLKSRVREGVMHAAKDAGYSEVAIDRSAIDAAAANPARWRLTQQGLVVFFEQYELGLGRVFSPAVMIPWPDMQDILQLNLGLPSGQ